MSVISASSSLAASGKIHSKLALGCWAFAGECWGGQEDEDSRETMQHAINRGITHFDTAIGYGDGHSERLVGEFIKDKREQVYLATKGGIRIDLDKFKANFEKSLVNLQAEYVDLYYIHWPNSKCDMRPHMEFLEKQRAAGRIKHIGVSNFTVEQMREVGEVGKIDAHQINYSLYWRLGEPEIIPYCRENGIAVVTYSSIAQGILTGKFPREPQFKKDDIRDQTVFFQPEVWPHLYEATEELKAIAAELGRPLLQLALQWVASRPGVESVIVGARNSRQLNENADALDQPLQQEVFDRMTKISDEALEHFPDAQFLWFNDP